jgi:asparagine synthase (glutamine-hydrolysing)
VFPAWPATTDPTPSAPPPDERAIEVAHALRASVRRLRGSPSPGIVLYSGGLDSSLVAKLLGEEGNTSLRTVGLAGAPDLAAGQAGAERLHLPWTGIVLDPSDLEVAWAGWGRDLQVMAEPRRSVLFALGAAFASCAGRTVWLGQGADELFGGYAHFAGLGAVESAARAARDLDQLCGHDWPATVALARLHSVRVEAPFLDPEFIAVVERIPTQDRFPSAARKELLRRAARVIGLSAALCDRPKKAMQYGSGVHRWVRGRVARG